MLVTMTSTKWNEGEIFYLDMRENTVPEVFHKPERLWNTSGFLVPYFQAAHALLWRILCSGDGGA